MSSADSVSRRLTAAPTVPYPSRATGTSTDAMNLRSLLPHVQRAKSCTDLLDLRLGQLRAVLLEERLEPQLDELRHAAAEHGLLAEQVGLGLLGEARLDHPRARGAERGAVRECEVARVAARVLRDRDDGRRSVALGVEAAHDVAGPLRRDHDPVVSL